MRVAREGATRVTMMVYAFSDLTASQIAARKRLHTRDFYDMCAVMRA